MNYFKKLVVAVVSATVFFTCLSCDIGLGASVDTEAPTLAITYPSDLAVIKGQFKLAGTYDDDMKVTTIKIVVTNNDSKATWSYEVAAGEKSGAWEVTLNPEDASTTSGFTYPDGQNYKADVTAYDGSSHFSGTATRSFIIDNTPPVLILSSPAKIGAEDASTYGRVLKLAGDISDDNSVSSLDMYLKQYDTTTNNFVAGAEEKHIAITTFTGMSTDNPLVVAKYCPESEAASDETKKTLRDAYVALYGSVSETTANVDKIFYSRIVLTDNAKTYMTVGDTGVVSGNVTQVYYINNDNFADNLMSEKTYSLTASKLRDILKGESSSYTEAQLTEIKKLLATSGYFASSTEITAAGSSKIALNPDNNPTYTLSSYSISESTDSSTGFNTYTLGSTIYINISAGRDKKYVVPSSVTATLYKLSSAKDTNVSDTDATDTFVLIKKGEWTDEAGLSCDKSLVLTSTDYPKLSANQYYRLVVTGNDRDGNTLEANATNGYGFKLRIAGNPPNLTVGMRSDTTSLVNVRESEYVSSDALSFSGSVSSETNTITSVAYKLVVTDENNDEVQTVTGNAKATDGVFDEMSEEWSFSLADNTGYVSSPNDTEYQYAFTIIATDDNSATATETRRICVDKKIPVVAITDVSPLAGTNKDCVNGTITVTGSITETYKSSATLIVSDGTTANTYKFSGVQQITQTVKTTDYKDKNTLTFTLSAADRAGNFSSSTETTDNVPVKTCTVDQSTDQPVITTSTSIDLQDSTKIVAGTKLFSNSNNALSGTITDDDGIDSIVITYATTADGPYTTLFSNTSVGGVLSYTLKDVLFKGNTDSTKDLADGLYYVKISVKDKAQEKATGYCDNNTDYFVVAVDAGAPSLSITNSDGMYQAVGKSFEVKGKAQDSGGNIEIYRSTDNVLKTTGDDADKLVTTITGTTEQSWTDSVAVASDATEGTTLYYIAIDSYSQSIIKTLSYKVDPNAPTFTITQIGTDTTAANMPTAAKTVTRYMQKGSTYTVTGTVADTGDSKLDGTVYYCITTTPPDLISGINAYDLSKGTWLPGTAQGTTGDKWKLNLDFSSLTEGTQYTVYIAAKDNAGNVSLISANPCANLVLTPDGTAPVVNTLASSDAQIIASEANESVTITASALTDYYSGTTIAGSGISTVKLYENGSEIGAMTTSDSGATYTYTFSTATEDLKKIYNAHLSTGTHTFVARATDTVGNISADKAVTVSVDITAPVVNISGVTPITTSGKVNGKITITGNATDETALASPLTWKVIKTSDATKTPVKSGEIIFDNTTYATYYGFTLELDTSSMKDGTAYLSGDYTIEITATDKAGNASSGDKGKRALSIDQSTDTPVVTLSNADTALGTVADIKTAYTGGTAAKTNIFTTTNTKLIGTITDDDGINKVTIQYRKSGTTDFTTVEKLAGGSTSYSLEYALPTTEAAYEVIVTAKDTKQETDVCDKATGQFMIAVDAGAPVFSLSNTNGKYYKAETSLAVAGTLKEASAVTFTTTNGKTPTVANGVFSDTIAVSGSDTASVTVTYVATDAYGQASTASFTYGIDSTAPDAVISATNTFTVGSTAFTSSDTSETWFNTTALAFSGFYKETGSGIAECSYFLNPTTIPVAANVADLTPTGTFSTTSATGDACKFSVSISNFKTDNSGLNNIYFAVKDNAGNYVVSSAYVIKIDQDVPTATCTSTSGIVLTNGNADLGEVSGTCSDSASGVKSVVLKIGTATVDATVTDGASWSASITKADVLSKLSTSTYPVTATITDKAGNVGTATFFSIQVDKTAPSAAISTSLATTKVNGKKTLSGTVTEENKPKSIALYYYSGATAPAALSNYTLFKAKTTDATPASPVTNTTYGAATADVYNWTFSDKFNFDTYADSTTGLGNVWLLPVVYDAAGNCNIADTTTGCATAATKYAVDRNADRPIIKLSNFSVANSTLKMTNTALGTITDDDGVSKFWITSNSTSADSAPSGTDAASLADGWVSVAVTDGSWSVNAGADGSRTWYFYVTDTESGTFSTKGNSSLARPYIIDSSTTITDTSANNSTGITFSVDTTAPAISTLAVYRSSSTTAPAVGAEDWTGSTITFGGNYPYLFAKVIVTEAVGMNTSAVDDISLAIGGSSVTLSASTNPKITRTSDTTTYTYIIGPVTVADISGTGVMSLAVTASDGAGLSANKTMNINKDSTGPTISITSPKSESTACVTSSATISGTVSDSGSGVSSIKYCIPTKAQITAGINGSTPSIWNTLSSTATVSISLGWSDISRYCNTEYATAVTGTNLVTIPVYFYATDDAGNATMYTDYKLYVDTEASKSSTGITYPTDLAAISSSVTVYGTASDDVSVSEVWVQLDVNGDSVFDAKDYAIIQGWTGSGLTLVPSDATVSGTTLSTTDAAGSWHIKAAGTNSWKLAVDASKISYTLGEGETLPHLGVRAISWDGTYVYDAAGEVTTTLHMRGWPTYDASNTDNAIRVTVDTGAPKISDFKVVQYNGTAAVKTLNYTSGMYISGVDTTKTWKLEGTVSDDKALDACTFTDVASTVGTLSDNTSYRGLSDSTDTASKAISMALTTSTTGKIYSQMVVTDTTGKTNQQYFIINVDNTAPAMYATDGTTVTTNDSANTSLRVKNTSSQNLGTTYVVENSDGSFTMGDTVTEADAGLSYLAFYFERKPLDESITSYRVYNPMFSSGNSSTLNKTITSGTTSGDIYINSDNLACMYMTGTTAIYTTEDTTTFTSAKIDSNANVRVGGLIKFQGVYRRISAVSGSTVTFSPATTAITTENGATAEVVYAQVVDHLGIEIETTTNGVTSVNNDDDDGMAESLKLKGSSYTWQATIASGNIPDGPAIIHVVAIDAAGNMSSGTVTTSIANNRPRIAKVLLATDLNGSGYFDYYNADGAIVNANSDKDTANNTQLGEFVYYSTLNKSTSKEQSLVTINTTKPFVVKNGLCLLPEFVGGNGVLKYGYGIGTEAASTPITGTSALASEKGTTAGTLLVADKTGTAQSITALIQSDKEGTANKYGGVVITDNSTTTGLGKYESWVGSTKTLKYLSFTFWDATEETTQGTNSLWAMVSIPAYINVTDDVAPEAAITPFYWNSKDDSSVPLDSDGSVLGHIDLEADLGATNPGVSGEVYVRGTAYDDTRLGSIFMTTPGTSETRQVALYKGGQWLTGSDTDSTNSQPYSTTWSWPTSWKSFEITSESEPSQDGHTVGWKFTVDMTKYGVVTAQTVQVQAKDAAATANASDITSTAAKTQTTKLSPTPTYIMDFVPYIKDISLETRNTYRSRLGRYPVQQGANIVIYGFNFASSAEYTVTYYKSGSDGKQGSTVLATIGNASITHNTDGQITVAAPNYSCYVQVETAPSGKTKVATQNNTNTNKGYNIENGYVVSEESTYGATAAASTGTNFWTDDRYLSVWNVSTSMPTDARNPISGTLKKSSTDTLYVRKSDDSVSKITGMTDRLFSVWASDDLQLYDFLPGENGTFDNIGLTQATFFEPPTTVDVCFINGTPWYVSLDNYVGGDSANSWGAGLFVMREGVKFTKMAYNGTTSQYKNNIEYQGVAVSRNSSAGFDSMKNQFKNPRITGYLNGTDGLTYVYVSYYDAYARCLKYAAYTEKIAFSNGVPSFLGTGQWEQLGNKSLTALMRGTDNLTTGKSVVAGWDTLVTNDSNFKEEAGEWSDIVMDGTTPVIIYYNKTSGCLEVARAKQKAPVSGNIKSTDETYSSDLTTSSTGWYKTTNIKPSGVSDFGRYVSCAIDSSGNLHVAAQDVDNGKLYYINLTKNGNAYETTKCVIVDSTDSVGRWTDIELRNSSLTGLSCEPVISYMNTSCLNTTRAIKVAYIDDTTNGIWEAMADPAKYEGYDQKTSVVADPYETETSTVKDSIAVGFNSSVFAIDFLRNEQ